jgi:hypothetical protein
LRTDNGGGAAGLFETGRYETLLIRPNPARESVCIEPRQGETGGRVSVFGPQGDKVFEQDINGFPLRMDLSGFAPGIYLIRIDGDRIRYSGKIIRE